MSGRASNFAAALCIGWVGTVVLLSAAPAAAAPFSLAERGQGAWGSLSWNSIASATVSGGWVDGSRERDASQVRHEVRTPNGRAGGWAENSLLLGQIHAEAWTLACKSSPCPGDRVAFGAGAAFWDTLRFDGSPIGSIPVSLTVDGWLRGLSTARARVYLGPSDPIAHLDHLPAGGWINLGSGESVLLEVDARHLGSSLMHVYAELDVSAWEWDGGLSDAHFGHTLKFSWSLPPGLTYTSASGLFMAEAPGPGPQPLPLPSSLQLLGLALVALAGLGRLTRPRQRPHPFNAP